MATVNVTFTRDTMVAGAKVAANSTADIEVGLAANLVYGGRATYTTAITAVPNRHSIVAEGVWAWSGTGTSNNIPVANLAAGDTVLCSLAVQGAAETLVKAVNDSANARIVATLSAAGTATTTKVNYLVTRPIY